MPVLRNIGMLATCRDEGAQDNIHPIYDAAVAWEGSTIRWVGHDVHLPATWAGDDQFDVGGRLVVPGLVDCHTHLAFAGWRDNEFEARLLGKSYLEIAREGGGILGTVEKTRNATVDDLVSRSERFLNAMMGLGVTTVEAKSGYGLTVAAELKQLRVYRNLQRKHSARIVPTFLAHVVPPEYRDDRGEYLRLLTRVLLPEVASERLAEFCDVFVEDTAFTIDEAKEIFEAASHLGLGLKIHADQFADTGGAALAASMGATSADHLESVSNASIAALAKSGTVAVTLPISALYMGLPAAPARRLLDAGVPVAVATDFNPGSAPSYHLPFAMTLACVQQRMTPNEVLKGVTSVAARTLRLENELGSIEEGKLADLVVVDSTSPAEWLYHLRANAVVATIARGSVISGL